MSQPSRKPFRGRRPRGISPPVYRAPTPARLVSHELVRHAAHAMSGPGGHDLEQWVIAARHQPSHALALDLGVAADAQYSSGHVVDGEQRWTYTARRPLSPGVCPRCEPTTPPPSTTTA